MSLGGDVRVALRGLRRQPGWAITAILTLALGIGANATMFGVVDRLLLSAPPHIAGPARVMRVGMDRAQGGGGRFTMTTGSYPDFTDVAGSGAFASVTGVNEAEMVLGTGSDARPVSAVKATGDYFTVMGTKPLLGRFFARDEDAAPSGTRVAVISSAFWRRAFGRSDSVLGHRISLDNAAYTVIGVAPADFTGDALAPVDVWVPLSSAMDGQDWRSARAMLLVRIVGRLKDGAPASLAAEQASLALRRGAVGSPYADSTARAVLKSVAPGWSGLADASTEGRIALWLAGMSAVVLLIAVVNVANLMLLRARQRRREVAVRLALGAPRWRLAQELAVEAALVVSSGGVAALAVAAWGGEWVRLVLLPRLAGQEHLVSGQLLLYTGLATIFAGVLAALVPVLRAGRVSVASDLSAGGGTGHGAPRLASGLLVLQAALSVILLAGAGAFTLSLHRVRNQDFGFKPEGILLAQLSFPPALPGYAVDRAYRDAAVQLGRMPGVDVVSVAQVIPFENHNVPPIAVPDRPDFPDQHQQAPFLNPATPTYFDLMGMHILEGRNFTAADGEGSPLVMIINQAMAKGLWPGESALGKCIRIGFAPGEMPSGMQASAAVPCRPIVGVVNDARPRSIREESGQARMQYYVPFGQIPVPPFPGAAAAPSIWGILVRSANPDALIAPMERLLQAPSTGATLATVHPLQDSLERQIRPFVLGAAMFSVFGLLALVLAAIGLYGVRAHAVTQRTREMGVRIALGATAAQVVQLVVLEGVKLALAGAAAGAVAVLALGNRLDPLLFQTSLRSPLLLIAVAGVIGLVAAVASAIPAWRAARVDAQVALRSE